jgi:hypothetical protein
VSQTTQLHTVLLDLTTTQPLDPVDLDLDLDLKARPQPQPRTSTSTQTQRITSRQPNRIASHHIASRISHRITPTSTAQLIASHHIASHRTANSSHLSSHFTKTLFISTIHIFRPYRRLQSQSSLALFAPTRLSSSHRQMSSSWPCC